MNTQGNRETINLMNIDSSLLINEIFYSIQGESTHAGRPCIFIRLAGCDLRCSYCDTEYAFKDGKKQTIDSVIKTIKKFRCNLVEITGGEPLLQKNVRLLLKKLCNDGYEALLETAGHIDINPVDKRVKIIMDIKCPSSGESEKMLWSNFQYLKNMDEVKFVIGDYNDFIWAQNIVQEKKLDKICPVIFSPVFNKLDNEKLANWILEENIPVRLQLQLHKYIWSPDQRGV